MNMPKFTCITLAIILFASVSLTAQMGKHGNVTLQGSMVAINEYTTLIADAPAGSTSINVASNYLNANGRFSGPLEAGDLIFIIQMKGVSINAYKHPDQTTYPTYSLPNDVTWGEITNYNNAGFHEFAEVVGVSGNHTIHLSCGLRYSYTASGNVQVIRVPRYYRLTVPSGYSISCDIWNGTTGGIIVMEIQDRLTLHGTIDVSGRGFRGGLATSGASNEYGDWQYGNNAPTSGEKGEGIFGYQSEYDVVNGRFCRGAAANAGGGGNNHNAGGGGGGNGGNPINWSGHGNPDISNSDWITAWNQESVNFAYHTSTGGGRGGYSYSFNDRDARTLSPGHSNWGGDYRRNVGGLGGRPLDYSSGRIFMGGGGGAGHQNETYGGNGGRGGGIVYIVGPGTIYGSGQILANGQNGGNAQGTPPWNGWAGQDGAGGGGAGGTVIANVENGFHSTSTITIRANGGKGGDQILSKGWAASSNYEAEGPGGGGSGGYIAISSGSPTREALGGANGTTNSNGLTEFPPNGATRGGNGTHNATISPAIIQVPSSVTLCRGENAVITASLSGGVPPGAQVIWYDSVVGGNVIHVGPTLTIPNVQNTMIVWVGFCPGGWYRKRVLISVIGPIASISPDTSICPGQSVQLSASGGIFYSWSPASSLNNANIANPIASPTSTTTYQVTVSDGFCEEIASVTVTVHPAVQLTTSPDTAICIGTSAQLVASGGTSYNWDNASTLSNPSIANPIATPTTTTTYSVTASNTYGCTQTASITVQVNMLPVVSLGPDTTLCEGDQLILDAGSGFIAYQWSTNQNTQTIQVTQTNSYSVTVTDNNNCQNKDTIYVEFLPNANATIISPVQLCVNTGPIQLIAAEPGGIWSGTGVTATGIFDPLAAGVGTHQIVYEISGLCGDSDTAYIQVHPLSTVYLGHDTTYCQGQIITLDAGSGFINYMWSTNENTQTIQVGNTGYYSVTVTDHNNCQNSDSIYLEFLPVANASITSPTDFCLNAGMQQLTAAQAGGVWFGSGVDSNGIFDPMIAGIGVHTIVYAISGQCGDTDTVLISVYPYPSVDLGNDLQACEGEQITLNAGTGMSAYHWSTMDDTQYITVTTSGTYSVTVVNEYNCSNSDAVNITFYPVADATITSPVPILCTNSTPVQLTTAQSGGQWYGTGISSTGIFDPQISGAGEFTIVYNIPGPCGNSDSIQIIVNPHPYIELISTIETCSGANDASIIATTTSGNPPYQYIWNNGYTGNVLDNLAPGTYAVTVTDSKNCSNQTSTTIYPASNECYRDHVFVPNIFSPNNDGANDILFVEGKNIESIEFIIFNRWGQKIFVTNNVNNGWDGTFKGKDVPEGVYPYVLKVKFLHHQKEQKFYGTISVVR